MTTTNSLTSISPSTYICKFKIMYRIHYHIHLLAPMSTCSNCMRDAIWGLRQFYEQNRSTWLLAGNFTLLNSEGTQIDNFLGSQQCTDWGKKKKKKVTMAYISSCVVASHFPNQHKDQLSHLWQLVSVQRRILKGQTWVLQVSQQDNLCLQKLQLEYDMLHWGQKKWAQDHVCEAHQFLQGSSGHHHRHHRC